MKRMKMREYLGAVAAALIPSAAFYIVYFIQAGGYALTVQVAMQACVLCALCGAAFILALRPQCNRMRVLLGAVIAVGIIMRVGYMLYTSVFIRGYDFGMPTLEEYGHAGYILRILNGRLPEMYYQQCYHPPLFHMLGAAAVWCFRAVSGVSVYPTILEAAKTVSCAASVLTLCYAVKICRRLEMPEGATLLVIGLAAFLPNHYLLAGRANNDALVVLFMTASIYYTLRWYREEGWEPLIKLALCYGLGTMTKMSMLAFAPVAGCAMLVILIRALRQKRGRKLIGQFAVFALIALPLGLWYPLRNYLLFRQPLSYIPSPRIDDPIFCGGRSLWERFGLGSISTDIYNVVRGDCNVWGYLWRSSLFGEFSFSAGTVLPVLMLAANLLLILGGIAGTVYVLCKRRSAEWLMLAGFDLILMLSYLVFNLKYPFGCTMDFRYVVPTALIGALFLGRAWQDLPQKRAGAAVRAAAAVCAAVLGICSVVMFCSVA